ncbi:hypothetical protein Pla175_12870 [Pirellulimonas nuda]|uniref:DNA primase/polymerase bifunctional N-terminal domain-containing protein n=1 Tax=Pirellulimonas nuda TaxID=2528009 RepID=A0A518D8Z3_9BACT|nr:bifunctional DNA primase/polymerase [Pirellulimonas nuda]QDU87920.1 hypothetical protein Pla175_12870 [Pirellulimonas nuda]
MPNRTSLIMLTLGYLRAGLCTLPAIPTEKRPALPGWRSYQQRLSTEEEIRGWFATAEGVCLLSGAVSGGLEMIDFDQQAAWFEPWREAVEQEAPGLVDRLSIERSQSGGKHVVYRCEAIIPGNVRLAQQVVIAPDAEPLVVAGKSFTPRRVGDRFEVTITLIETRGEGGLFLCAPTPGYEVEQGDLTALPVLTAAERDVLIEAATALNEAAPPNAASAAGQNGSPVFAGPTGAGRPGDDYNQRGDLGTVLQRHGWRRVGGDNSGHEYWRRPGKQNGQSASLSEQCFYVFSSNAPPFDPERGYAPFSVYTLLEHGGDFAAAAAALRAEGYGSNAEWAYPDVDLSGFRLGGVLLSADPAEPPGPPEDPAPDAGLLFASPSQLLLARPPQLLLPAPTRSDCELSDPGPLPPELLRVPGFVDAVVNYCLSAAPYPNLALAFCGALALLAMLAGRKVRDEADNRTNLYLLALAHSAVGKDFPRKLNAHILQAVGLLGALGDKFASGEGIQDALFLTPSMLFQTDEIDGLLQSINNARDARHEAIMSTLLSMYSAASSVYPMRRKAGQDSPGFIEQPCLVVYGTAIPTHYYAAISERMLTNGLFARMMILESGSRSAGQEPQLIAPPRQVLQTASWWAGFNPGGGNLTGVSPTPLTVEADGAARELLADARRLSEAEYAAAESRSDAVATTVWGRVPELVRKLALLHAISDNHQAPRIGEIAARWATELSTHQTRRMLFMARHHVADNPFHADCLRLVRKLQEAPDRTLPHSVLLKRMKLEAKRFQELIVTLEQQGDVVIETHATGGRPGRCYRLVE